MDGNGAMITINLAEYRFLRADYEKVKIIERTLKSTYPDYEKVEMIKIVLDMPELPKEADE